MLWAHGVLDHEIALLLELRTPSCVHVCACVRARACVWTGNVSLSVSTLSSQRRLKEHSSTERERTAGIDPTAS